MRLEDTQMIDVLIQRRRAQAPFLPEMVKELRCRFLKRDRATSRRADETGDQQPEHLLDGCPRVRSTTLTRAFTVAPRPMLLHPVLDDRLQERREVRPRRCS